MRLNDAVLGAVLLVFGIAVFAYTRTFPEMPGQRYGSALFPSLIGIGLGVCGSVLVVQGLRERRVAGGPFVAWPAARGDRWNVVLVLGAILFYIVAAEPLGFIPTGTAILTSVLVRLGTRVLPALGIALATTLIIHTLFSRLLLVPLPWGLLQPVAW